MDLCVEGSLSCNITIMVFAHLLDIVIHERLDPPLSGQYYIYSRECASAICHFHD